MRELELLAPARNIEIGIAAIDCGADAVYLAGPAFGARQAAGNSVEDIRRLCEYAHRFGARVFVTLNTIIFDSELEEAFALAVQLQEAGADALIVQDFALPAFEIEHPQSLSIPLHASTQCSIRTVGQARRMDALGFSRIVLERELPMAAVREICSAVSCEVEAFVHGALCVCYSGECYLSEMLSGRSANRGECVQACRSRYDLVNAHGEPVRWPKTDGRFSGVHKPLPGQDGFRAECRPGQPVAMNRTLLSLRDLMLLERLPEMAEGGVTSFKIEGRLKNISYVRNIVAAYSQALDRLVAANPDKYCRAAFGHADCGFIPAPPKSFNRGFTQLFFDGRRGRWACLDAGKALGEEVGTVSSVSRAAVGGMRICVSPRVRPGDSPVSCEQAQSNAAAGDRPVHCRQHSGKAAAGRGNVLPEFHNGDGFSFIGRDGKETGFRADICDGNVIFCRAVDGLSPGTPLYRNLDTAFERGLEKGGVRRITVGLSVEINEIEGPAASPPGEGNGVGNFLFHVRAVSEDGREVQHDTVIKAEPARNRERMLGMISGQLDKDASIYSFAVSDIRCNGRTAVGSGTEGVSLPIMGAAQLNAIRREIAGELDGMPCKARPLNRATIGGSLPGTLKFPERISYKSDVANGLAASLYSRLGAETIEPAYEALNRRLQIGNTDGTASAEGKQTQADGRNIELMRSKYCLLHELGLCRKTPVYTALAAANDIREGLYLRNNGRLLRLHFDCKNCEMIILSK